MENKDWKKQFEEEYCNFEISERISKSTMLAIIPFIESLLKSKQEEIGRVISVNGNVGAGYTTQPNAQYKAHKKDCEYLRHCKWHTDNNKHLCSCNTHEDTQKQDWREQLT